MSTLIRGFRKVTKRCCHASAFVISLAVANCDEAPRLQAKLDRRLSDAGVELTALVASDRQQASPDSFQPQPRAASRVGPTLPIGKCLNYAGQLEVAMDEPWMRPVVPSDFSEMAAEGFRTLRAPLNLDRHAAATPPFKIEPAYLDRVRAVVTHATAAGLNVIIESHVNDRLYASPPQELARTAEIWRQLSTAFRDAPPTVWFELLNEPRPPITNVDVQHLLPTLIAAVRETNPTRPIIIGGEDWSSVDGLVSLRLPDDPFLVPTFHYYRPMAFTHQGAPWAKGADGRPYPLGTKFGGARDYAALAADVARVQRYMAESGRSPFLGEFGVLEIVPDAERAEYYHAVTRAFASIGVDSCVWGYVNNFPIRDEKGWRRQLIDAIASTTPAPERKSP